MNAGMDQSQYLAFWSYGTSAATILVAFIGPIFGTIADNKGFKKPLFMTVLAIGVIGCALLGVMPNWILYLVTYVIAKVAYQASLVFYDSMLTDVTTPERMDLVSSQGYAWGYIGSCIPFVAALAFYALGMYEIMPMNICIMIDFLIIAVWWLGVSVPLIKEYQQKYYVESSENKITASFKRLGSTLSKLFHENKKVFYFLIGFFFYIDGVYTIIDEAVAIGRSFGFNDMVLLVVLLLTQVVAFVFATIFGKLTEKYSSVTLITVCIAGYTFVALFALTMHAVWQFGVMAFVVGMFQGAIQALSRSYFAQIIPADNSGEYFGLYDICGKGAAFMGTMMVGFTVQITHSTNIAVGTLAILFIIGYLFLRKSSKM
jgi:UMF1 family MFS transporter